MSEITEAAVIPDSKLARAITEYIRDTETDLLFNHSSRVYQFGTMAGVRRGLTFDRELLYAGAMFHDIGLMPGHGSQHERFEVDGAHAARDFLRSHGISEADAYTVWTAIALHTTPGVPQHMHPVVALVTAGVEMDVLGLTYDEYSDAEREAVVKPCWSRRRPRRRTSRCASERTRRAHAHGPAGCDPGDVATHVGPVIDAEAKQRSMRRSSRAPRLICSPPPC
ncbi:metal dependent phosphohydrolase CDS [Bradyrhizobium sp.]|uniref:HD domain-containing protein n=1 Tax=Bradyrhizobium sp. TaxID=376 RepID=UPI0007C1E345|nr:HD domain-containing protein [Bradyrhizobium sp.]CUU22237.1 metal dependent phosphohydrolase CDS [Bradyrhizobium sp.]